MSFQNLRARPIIQAVILVFVMSLVVTFAIQGVYVMSRMADAFSELDPNATQEEQQALLQDEIDTLMTEALEGSSTLNTLFMVQWALTGALTFLMAWRTARRNAASPEQGAGYGAVVGLGVLLLYGPCFLSGTIGLGVRLIFMIVVLAAGSAGGQLGGTRPVTRKVPPALPVAGDEAILRDKSSTPRRGGLDPETYYNMGVQAALGGRREEARQHFTRVLQMQPRHVPAWLQLANLADTPDQAWNYVQQARAISPSAPAVQQAVEVIWPKVAASAQQVGPSPSQPPYPGGQQDDTAIPRSTLPPGVYAEAPTEVGGVDIGGEVAQPPAEDAPAEDVPDERQETPGETPDIPEGDTPPPLPPAM